MEHIVKLKNIKLIGNCVGFLSTFPINESTILKSDGNKVQKEITYSRIIDIAKIGDGLTLDLKVNDIVILRKNCVNTDDAIIVQDMCTDKSMTILIKVPHYDIEAVLEKDATE